MKELQWYVVVAVYCGPSGELIKESSPLHEEMADKAVRAIRSRCGMYESAYLRKANDNEVVRAMDYMDL